MSMAWPFLVTANKALDYRFVVLPPVITNEQQAEALLREVNDFHQGTGADNFKPVPLPGASEVTLFIERIPAIVDGAEARDRGGRNIYRLQGILFAKAANSPKIAAEVPSALIRSMRDELDRAFAAFWPMTSFETAWIGRDLSNPVQRPPTPPSSYPFESRFVALETARESLARQQRELSQHLAQTHDLLSKQVKDVNGALGKLASNVAKEVIPRLHLGAALAGVAAASIAGYFLIFAQARKVSASEEELKAAKTDIQVLRTEVTRLREELLNLQKRLPADGERRIGQ